MTTTHYRSCPLCEATCGVAITTDGDRVVSVRGDDADPFSKGYICPKATALADLHSDPDRLRRPLVPLLSAYYAVPTFVFYPLLIVAFGVGRTALIVMGALFGIVAMIVNTTLGLDHVPPAVDRTGARVRGSAGRVLARRGADSGSEED